MKRTIKLSKLQIRNSMKDFSFHCSECGGVLIDSTALQPQQAITVEPAGESRTIMECSGKFVACKKCKECGHSFIPSNA